MEETLTIDCTFTPQRISRDTVAAILREMQNVLLDFSQSDSPPSPLIQSGNASGALWYRAEHRRFEQLNTLQRESVLLTGTTGFVGVHILQELLKRTRGTLYCIIRAPNDFLAQKRLLETLDQYQQKSSIDAIATMRLVALAGDISKPDLGLAPHRYAQLRDDLGAIYNSAADVRLFVPLSQLKPVNVDGVKHLLKLAAQGGNLDFHHVSTLSIAGTSTAAEPLTFDESTFDTGQTFRNSYEESKHTAEEHVRKYALSGARAMIYRLGNVCAHSHTGCFQQNASENQIVQIIQASLYDPRLTFDQPLTLAPVDIVAAGIVALSMDTTLKAATFHVDSPHEDSYGRLIDCAREIAAHWPTAAKPSGLADQEISNLAKFWLTRPQPNVDFLHHRTRHCLARLGVNFKALDNAWFEAFISHLLRRGSLDSSTIYKQYKAIRPPQAGAQSR